MDNISHLPRNSFFNFSVHAGCRNRYIQRSTKIRIHDNGIHKRVIMTSYHTKHRGTQLCNRREKNCSHTEHSGPGSVPLLLDTNVIWRVDPSSSLRGS